MAVHECPHVRRHDLADGATGFTCYLHGFLCAYEGEVVDRVACPEDDTAVVDANAPVEQPVTT